MCGQSGERSPPYGSWGYYAGSDASWMVRALRHCQINASRNDFGQHSSRGEPARTSIAVQFPDLGSWKLLDWQSQRVKLTMPQGDHVRLAFRRVAVIPRVVPLRLHHLQGGDLRPEIRKLPQLRYKALEALRDLAR